MKFICNQLKHNVSTMSETRMCSIIWALRKELGLQARLLTIICISQPSVPVRAEMVLVIDLAYCATYLAAQAASSPSR